MAVLKKRGAPTKKTVGAVGDIYIDKVTGNKYKCTFAYSDVHGNKDCDWKLIENNSEEVIEEIEEEVVVEDPVVIEDIPTKEEATKPVTSTKNNKPYKDYRNQYKGKK